MNTEKSIAVLNTLVEINNDRVDGYETAIKEAEEADLKTLFSQMKETSIKCRSELAAEIKRLGGQPTEGTTTSGKFFRIWMDIKAAFTGKDRKTILDSCEFGEDAAVATYKEALKNSEDLTSSQQMMVQEQHLLIKEDHDRVKRLRDMMFESSKR